MSPSVEQMKRGTCGCGRSPTGNCIGWHSLSESAFQAKLESYIADEEAKEINDNLQGD